jgi:hypothetical protein
MPINYLDTQVKLPPGKLSGDLVKELLGLMLRKFRWFEPKRYGYADLDKPIDPSRLDLNPLIAYFEERHYLCVAARTDKDFIWLSPSLPDEPPYIGEISWMTSATSSSKASWRAAHLEQVAELMRLVQSPLAFAGVQTDLNGKQRRLVHKSTPTEDGKAFTSSTHVPTVRGYGEGLPGVVWRNFYGPPFVRMFGERLAALPPECRMPLGEDIVLVQPYALPTEAGTEAGVARERELISLLGPECFYDHERHTPPTRRPVLDALGQPLH